MKNIDIEKYYNELNALDTELNELKKRRDAVKSEIVGAFEDEFKGALKSKPEPFGKVNVVYGEYDMHYTVPKKVVWDQKKLAEIYKMIGEHEDPGQYIKVSYDVNEIAYKNWPQDIKDVFEPARTVKPGSAQFVIVNLKEE